MEVWWHSLVVAAQAVICRLTLDEKILIAVYLVFSFISLVNSAKNREVVP